MNKAKFQSVEDYTSSQPKLVALKLAAVRRAIRKALPRAEQVISYNMPAYKLHGEVILSFAGWKQHYSIYPASGRLVAKDLHVQVPSLTLSLPTRALLCSVSGLANRSLQNRASEPLAEISLHDPY